MAPPNAGSGPHPGPVAIFHIGRCGSTVIERMLTQHPEIHAAAEIFATKYRARGPDEIDLPPQVFLRRRHARVARERPRVAHYLYEIKFLPGLDPDLFGGSLAALVDAQRSFGVRRAIVLRRRNALRRLVSTLIAVERGAYQIRPGQPASDVTVTLPLDHVHLGETLELTEMLQRIEASHDALCALLDTAGIAALTLSYEDHILPDPNIATGRILSFLGAAPMAMTPTLSRIQTAPLDRTLRNYDAVAARLAGTPYAWMLHAP